MRRVTTAKVTKPNGARSAMSKSRTSLDAGRRVLDIEARAVQALIQRLDGGFSKAVDLLYDCKGKVVVSGMGKSGLIGQKIAATMASTGTPSFFLHPAEGLHGDLGMLARRDVLIAISNSGETQEILQLLPFMERMGIPVVSIVGRMSSTLAKNSAVALDVSVAEEACPMGLAPTASTTATLAMGDALAVALLEKRGFKEQDFAQFHPGGTGKSARCHAQGAGRSTSKGDGLRLGGYSRNVGEETRYDHSDRSSRHTPWGDYRRRLAALSPTGRGFLEGHRRVAGLAQAQVDRAG
jgi:arabinose-5-phosphate isomerase